MLMNALQHLTDDELVERIAALNGTEREATAALVAHLAELESRDLHLALGFRSLYGYCRAVLHLSEHESYNRMEAAKVARRFPVIVPMLAAGLLHLTAVRLLALHLGDENHLALLGVAIHKSKAEVKETLAAWFPKPAVRTSIRRIPSQVAPGPADGAAMEGANPLFAGTGAPPNGGAKGGAVGSEEPATDAATSPASAAPSAAPAAAMVARSPAHRKATIEPLSAESYAMRLTARRATIERLRRAQEILSHAVPDGDVDEVLYRALGALIEKEGKEKLVAAQPLPRRRQGQRRSPRPADRASGTADPASRTVTAEVERQVRGRDGEQCAFVSKDGRRCEERRFLELHHLTPWIVGGGRTARNISLRCRAHNQYEWKVYVAPINAAREVPPTRSGTS